MENFIRTLKTLLLHSYAEKNRNTELCDH